MTTAEAQRALSARGYDLGSAGADGDSGPCTIAAVKAFQRTAGLVADVIADRILTSYNDIVDRCCDAWNRLTKQRWKSMSLGLRDWPHRC